MKISLLLIKTSPECLRTAKLRREILKANALQQTLKVLSSETRSYRPTDCNRVEAKLHRSTALLTKKSSPSLEALFIVFNLLNVLSERRKCAEKFRARAQFASSSALALIY